MKIISHRGNISGPNQELENHPDYIRESLKLGYDCEIDVWYRDNEWWLGHDEPVYDISKGFLRNEKLWCHAKNIHALHQMLKDNIHCFWHQQDDYTLTSKGFIWTYPNKLLTLTSVAICLDGSDSDLLNQNIAGICTDYTIQYTV